MEFFLFWVFLGIVVALIARSKGRSGLAWFFYGFLIWPVALVHVLVAGRDVKNLEFKQIAEGASKKCIYCAEVIRAEATICRYCRQSQAPAKAPDREINRLTAEGGAVPSPSVREHEVPNLGAVAKAAGGQPTEPRSVSSARGTDETPTAKRSHGTNFVGALLVLIVASAFGLVAYTIWDSAGKSNGGTPTSAPADIGEVEPGTDDAPLTADYGTAKEEPLQTGFVRLMQELLAELGYDPGPADGILGERTVAAVKAYQRNAGLTVDGQITESLFAYAIEEKAMRTMPEREALEKVTPSNGRGIRESPADQAEAALAPKQGTYEDVNRYASRYEEMERYAQSLTEVQFDSWAAYLKGRTVLWTGIVVDMETKWISDDMEVMVDMDNTGVQDVYFDVPPGMGRYLHKGQTITFKGRIKNVINTLGLFQITLEHVDIE